MPVFTGNWFGFGRNPSAGGAVAESPSPVFPSDVASGGYIEVTDPGVVRHVFCNPGNFVVGPDHPGTVAFFVIGGGGGGGGSHHGGGGGAGALVSDPSHPVPAATYPITVGIGGRGGKGNQGASGKGGYGVPSAAFGATAEGGGGGGWSPGPAGPGGSGGGAGGSGAPNAPGPAANPTPGPGQYAGNAGGGNSGHTGGWYGSAGGGGAGSAGGPNGEPGPDNRAGNGGNGAPLPAAMSAIGGSPTGWAADPTTEPNSVYLAAGGGGATYNQGNSVGLGQGGHGGGGPGSQSQNAKPSNAHGGPCSGVPGRTWFGCGGGGGERQGVGGGSGGDGMVCISYTLPGPVSDSYITNRSAKSKLVEATGGIITELANPDGASVDRVHAFSWFASIPSPTAGEQAEQAFTVSSVAPSSTMEVLLVGGGGGGGWKGGGGGGGECVHHPGMPITAQTYIVQVGRGGAGDGPSPLSTGSGNSAPGTVTLFGPPTSKDTWGAGGGGHGGYDDPPNRSGGAGYNG